MESETRDGEERHRLGVTAINLGLFVNLVLAAAKTVTGILGHSSALLADGINSTSDVVYFVVVRIFMAVSRKPADREHPYGHSQLESIAALVVAAFVITTAVALFWDAINDSFDIFTGKVERGAPAMIALWIALGTVAVKTALAVYTRRVARTTRNAVVDAVACDHRNDVFSAGGAAVGIFLGGMGLQWADPVAGAVVSLVVLRTGLQILRDASSNLMDAVPGESLEIEIKGLLREVPGVLGVEEVHAHHFGPYLVINVTIRVDGALTVADGDRVASRVEQTLCARMEYVRRVYVHVHAQVPK